MSALPRPDLPAGPHRDLASALHDLHHRAGWPSLRALARETGVSHTTVSKVFSSPALPTWGTLELVVEALDGDTARFHDLWLTASAPTGTVTIARPRIAGRRAELDAVRRHLEHGTGLLLVTGEAGMGKTALAEEAVRTSPVLTAKGRCLPLSTEVPLLPLADCLREIWEADPDLVTGVARTCPAYVPSAVASLLPEIGDGPRVVMRADDRALLFSAVAAVLRGVGEVRPVALVVEDLHWSDAATLDLVEHLLGRGTPIPIVATWRSLDPTTSPAHDEWAARVRRLSATTLLELAPLTLEETEEQLALLGGPGGEPAHVVHARSGGQPLFTEQLAWHAGDRPHLPQVLGDLLDRRLEGVSGPAWALLRALGIAERPMPVALLADVVGCSDDELTELQRDLVDRRLLRSSGQQSVELQHPLLADAVQRRLVAGEAEQTHRALAVALSATLDPEAAEVAEHWRRAGEPVEELPWRIRAAQTRARHYDRAQEADHWLRALAIWPAPGASVGTVPTRHVKAYLGAMDALRASFRHDEATALSEEVEATLGGAALDDRDRADLLFRQSIYRGEPEGFERGLALLDQALAIHAGLPVSEGMVRALDLKQNMLFALGRAEESRLAAQEEVTAARELGDPVLLREALMRVAWHVGTGGDTVRGLRLLDLAAADAGTDEDPLGDVRQGVYATDLLLTCGAPTDEVVEAGATALEVADDLHLDNPQVMMVRVNVAFSLLRAGRVNEADDIIGTPSGSPFEADRWPLHAGRAVIDSRRGEHEHALERVRSIWDEPRSSARVDLEFLAWAGDVAWWSGALTERWPALVEHLRAMAAPAPVRLLAPVLLVVARGVDALPGAHDVDLVGLARDCGLLADTVDDDPQLMAHRTAYEAEVGRGRPGAVQRWTRAAAAWEDVARPHDAAYARWRAAQCALRDGQGTLARRLLRRAAADASTHVPLSRAIAETAATGR